MSSLQNKWVYLFRSFPKLGRPNGKIILSPGPDNKRQSKIIWESKNNIWDVDLLEIMYEWIYWKLPWNCMGPADLAKTVTIAFLLFLSSNFDVFADAQLSYFYFAGATYDFYFHNNSDPAITQCVSIES